MSAQRTMHLVAERLGDLDVVFLEGDGERQHLHVLATLIIKNIGRFSDNPYAVFQQRLRERVPLIEPMRRHAVSLPFGARAWVDDPLTDLDRHLHHVVVDGGGMEALAREAGRIASAPMPKDAPLWEAWFVEGLSADTAGVVAKVHHAAVDGVAGIWSLAAFFDLERDPAPMELPVWAPEPPSTRELASIVVDHLRQRAGPAAVRRVGRVAKGLASIARADREVAPLPLSAPQTSFNGSLSGRREVALTTVPLDELKAIRRAFGLTINDVVVGLMSGVVRDYLRDNGEPTDRALTAAVPASERGGEQTMAGNQLSFMIYSLPVHLDDPAERLAAVQRSANAAKRLHTAAGGELYADLAGLIPPRLVNGAVRALAGLRVADRIPPFANVIVSNVNGPDFPLYVAGSDLECMFPLGPLLEGIGLRVTVVTYRDQLDVGFVACPDLLPDVASMPSRLDAELHRLQVAGAGR